MPKFCIVIKSQCPFSSDSAESIQSLLDSLANTNKQILKDYIEVVFFETSMLKVCGFVYFPLGGWCLCFKTGSWINGDENKAHNSHLENGKQAQSNFFAMKKKFVTFADVHCIYL